jgi:hypothetical protein
MHAVQSTRTIENGQLHGCLGHVLAVLRNNLLKNLKEHYHDFILPVSGTALNCAGDWEVAEGAFDWNAVARENHLCPKQ